MILLLGATGYLGQGFARELRRRGSRFVPLSRSALDYTRFELLFDYVRKMKPDFVINAAGLRLTGNKAQTKVYHRHSGYPGGVRTRTAGSELQQHPDRILRQAVTGMLPKNRLGRQLATKLKIYTGQEHPHAAQQPVALA